MAHLPQKGFGPASGIRSSIQTTLIGVHSGDLETFHVGSQRRTGNAYIPIRMTTILSVTLSCIPFITYCCLTLAEITPMSICPRVSWQAPPLAAHPAQARYRPHFSGLGPIAPLGHPLQATERHVACDPCSWELHADLYGGQARLPTADLK